jgi:hypothetical protein
MEIRNSLTQKFETLAGEIGALNRHSGDVAAWMREIGYQTAADRVVGHRKDNRNDPRRPLERRNARSVRNNDIDFPLHELGRNLCDAFGTSLRPPIFDGDVAALDPAQLTKPLSEASHLYSPCRHVDAQDTDGWHLARLLRERVKRPSSC